MTGRAEMTASRARKPTPTDLGRAVGVATLGVLAVFHGLDELPAQSVWTILGLVVIGFLVLTLRADDVRAFLSRLQKVSVGPVSAELQAAAKGAAESASAEREEEEDVPNKAFPQGVDLRLRLQAKITYLAKHVLCSRGDQPSDATFVTVGSLWNDGYLTDDEARTADAILTLSSTSPPVDPLSPSRQEFLARADTFVTGFRATVFHGLVRTLLGADGATVEQVSRRGKARADIRTDALGTYLRVVPVFSTNPHGELVRRELSRRPDVDDTVIVVLPINEPGGPGDHDRGVYTLQDLRDELTARRRAGAVPVDGPRGRPVTS